ncbi:MAG: methyltransferase domain-containing protein [Actinomycetota bacterium]|nr:methyltransferase domain-containing protein [Actinomycetota bacterium]
MIPVWRQEHNLERLLPSLRDTLQHVAGGVEIIVACGPENRHLEALTARHGSALVVAGGSTYGEVLAEGLRHTRGDFVLTMDADFSHRPGYVTNMWANRDQAEVLIGSRYIRGAYAEMSWARRIPSRILNWLYRKVLLMPYRDLSSGFRMYRREVLEDIGLASAKGLDVLPEMLAKAYCQGWRILEVPFWYRGARPWTRARVVRLGVGYLATLGKVFTLRNSVKAADYDHRAFDSWIPLQRYWQRRRFTIIQEFVSESGSVLDVGCGTSRIIQTLPHVVGMDVAIRKLRWLRSPGRPLVQGTLTHLPFRDHAFDALVCSEVIEHIPREQVRIEELIRVLSPGGTLILGTPDYSRKRWRFLEWAYAKVFPGGYVLEHINRYTYSGLREELESMGLEILDCEYVGGSEMIFKVRVPYRAPQAEEFIAQRAHSS